MNQPLPNPFLLLDLQAQTIHWPIPTKIDVSMTVVIPKMPLYAEAQLLAYGKAEYERGLLDAMNATRAFGKTGEENHPSKLARDCK